MCYSCCAWVSRNDIPAKTTIVPFGGTMKQSILKLMMWKEWLILKKITFMLLHGLCTESYGNCYVMYPILMTHKIDIECKSISLAVEFGGIPIYRQTSK